MSRGIQLFVGGANHYCLPTPWQADRKRVDDIAQKIFDSFVIAAVAAPFIFFNSTYVGKGAYISIFILACLSRSV